MKLDGDYIDMTKDMSTSKSLDHKTLSLAKEGWHSITNLFPSQEVLEHHLRMIVLLLSSNKDTSFFTEESTHQYRSLNDANWLLGLPINICP